MSQPAPAKILVADDSRDIVMILDQRLTSNGYQVVTAFDGAEALQKAKQERPDLIILDVMMPKLNGFQTARMIKFDKQLKHIPVLLLTARTQQMDKDTGTRMGADEYLTKPYDAEHLLARVRYWLDQRVPPTPTPAS